MFGVKYLPNCTSGKIIGFTKEDFSTPEEAEAWLAQNHFCAKCKDIWNKVENGSIAKDAASLTDPLAEENYLSCLSEWEIYDVVVHHKYMEYCETIVSVIDSFANLTLNAGFQENDLRECLQTLYDNTQDDLNYYTSQGDEKQIQIHTDVLTVLEQVILNRE